MGAAAGVGVLGPDAQADHEGAVVVLAIEERPVVIEERAGAEQRLEALAAERAPSSDSQVGGDGAALLGADHRP